MFTIIEPRDGESVKLLRPEHLAYIVDPGKCGVGTVDFLNLRAEGADLSAPREVILRYTPSVDAEVLLGTRASVISRFHTDGTAPRSAFCVRRGLVRIRWGVSSIFFYCEI